MTCPSASAEFNCGLSTVRIGIKSAQSVYLSPVSNFNLAAECRVAVTELVKVGTAHGFHHGGYSVTIF